MDDNVEDITTHERFAFRDAAADDLYTDIMKLVQKYAEQGAITATDAVGVLEWAKTSIVIMNTEFES